MGIWKNNLLFLYVTYADVSCESCGQPLVGDVVEMESFLPLDHKMVLAKYKLIWTNAGKYRIKQPKLFSDRSTFGR